MKSFEQPDGRWSENVFVAGRIVGILDDGFVLQDDSGRLELVYREAVNVGDIVEARVWAREARRPDGRARPGDIGKAGRMSEDGGILPKRAKKNLIYKVRELKVLVPCRDEFFIRKSDSNWRKMVIDTHKRELMRTRALIVKKMREFFWSRGFEEAETPLMVRRPGMEPHLDPFKTTLSRQPFGGGAPGETGGGEEALLGENMYLITSPEYAMKKLLAAGYEKIFQLGKSFRNKETDGSLHNPEFTLLEWYRAYADYSGIMKDTEELVDALAMEVCGKHQVVFAHKTVDTKTPWPRARVKDLFKEYAGIAEETLLDKERLRAAVLKKGYKVDRKAPYEDLFYLVFLNEIEPNLGVKKPVIVHDYPVAMAALAKKSEADPRYAERFEAYIAGVELCNAFTELNDPVEQEWRLKAEMKHRKILGKDQYGVDQSFIGALKFGMPPSGGNALGVDRLAMILTDTEDINDIMQFPLRDL